MSKPQLEQSSPSNPDLDSTSITSPRSLKQLTFFIAGSTFFALSSLITRRAVVRRYAATAPRFYAPSNRPPQAVNGHLEAFEALNIATINVMSFMMMLGGGAFWAFDISGMDELRRRLRRKDKGELGEGRSDEAAEEELEHWLAKTLGGKDEKKRSNGSEDEQPTIERRKPR
ncbi:hypothetical protein G7Y79_00004g014210 [Physcia stellaris]|nr:hypothetical protein G7Y79_00004g014210 [Physcia stellaris]